MNSIPHTPDILVVDDDPRNRKLLEEYLIGAGYDVRLANDGRSALSMALERPPDLVLLDVMMPDLSGRLQPVGMGFKKNLVGTGTDDMRDALDRRVEFKVRPC